MYNVYVCTVCMRVYLWGPEKGRCRRRWLYTFPPHERGLRLRIALIPSGYVSAVFLEEYMSARCTEKSASKCRSSLAPPPVFRWNRSLVDSAPRARTELPLCWSLDCPDGLGLVSLAVSSPVARVALERSPIGRYAPPHSIVLQSQGLPQGSCEPQR